MSKEVTDGQAKKHLKEIVLLFSVPLGIVLVIVALLYVPRLFANPTYDFIYCQGYSCDGKYIISPSGNLSSASEEGRISSYRDSSLYYYDAQRDATRPLHLDEAARYQLDATSKSPEGYTLERASNSSGFLFWGDYSNTWSLKKGLANKPISLDSSSYDNKFIGWVLP